MTELSQYQEILEQGIRLLDTFTISYPYGLYRECRFSSTYEGMSGWVRDLLSLLAESGPHHREDPFYLEVRGYRGKIGNLDRASFLRLLEGLRERCRQ